MTDTQARTDRRQPAWLTVAVREVMVKLTDRAFIIGTLSTLGLVIAALAASFLLGGRPQTTKVVVASPQAAVVADAAGLVLRAANEGAGVEVHQVADEQAARDIVQQGAADVFLREGDGHWVLLWRAEPKPGFDAAIREAVTALTISDLAAKAGTTPQQVREQLTVASEALNRGDVDGQVGYFVALAFAVLFMMSTMVYGMQIATSVIEEKQSRIVEILVCVIPVRQLLAGKVLGNTIIAFAQMVLLLGAGLVGLTFAPLNVTIPNLSSAIGWFLVFFLAGFLALACVWAAAGALGTRAEDLNQTSQPLIWVVMIAYAAGFTATGTARVVLSYVPITSSVLMPVRLVEGTASWWEPVLALAINLVFAVAMVLLGERIYRRALLRTHGRLTFHQALALKD